MVLKEQSSQYFMVKACCDIYAKLGMKNPKENNLHLWIKSLFPFHITVDDGAIVDVIFDSFRCSQIPSGFDRIMVEKALLWDIDISQMNVVNVLLLYLLHLSIFAWILVLRI